MSEVVEFEAWPKIPRLNREIIITEKIDGTNAAVIVKDLIGVTLAGPIDDPNVCVVNYNDRQYVVAAQSRTKLIRPGKQSDNAGFAGWVWANAEELIEKLGEGTHFGEWYGGKIQRGYGLDEKRFMLFNTTRWQNAELPEGVEVATVLYQGPFDQAQIEVQVHKLRRDGSKHVPGYDKPEGVVVFHTAANQVFKVLCENDELPKGVVENVG